MAVQRILTSKSDPAVGRLDTEPAAPLAEGQVRLAVRRIALTTNNITYALFGDRMQYWQFFPSGQADWGIVPVWGFADVVASAVPDLAVGERVYGYLPLAERVACAARSGSTAEGFVDAAAHRAGLAAVYNRYVRCAADADYRREDEDALMIVRPLFTTAYPAERLPARAGVLRRHAGAAVQRIEQDGVCHRLVPEAGTRRPCTWSASRRPRNRDFVRALGCYDRVLTYDEVASLDRNTPTVFADFSGSAEQRARLHRHFGDALRHSAVIGATQFSAGEGRSAARCQAHLLLCARPGAPAHRGLGRGGVPAACRRSQRRFLERALDAQAPWLRIVEHQGLESAIGVLRALAQGGVDPRQGHAIHVG